MAQAPPPQNTDAGMPDGECVIPHPVPAQALPNAVMPQPRQEADRIKHYCLFFVCERRGG